jgi:hypothetical protein
MTGISEEHDWTKMRLKLKTYSIRFHAVFFADVFALLVEINHLQEN